MKFRVPCRNLSSPYDVAMDSLPKSSISIEMKQVKNPTEQQVKRVIATSRLHRLVVSGTRQNPKPPVKQLNRECENTKV